MGRRGEDAAAAWYESQGFAVVERNWRCDIGELDLIAVRFVGRSPALAVFVEVKARSNARFGEGVLAVGPTKQARIRRLAGAWLSQQRVRFGELRFDIADVDGRGDLTVYEAAF